MDEPSWLTSQRCLKRIVTVAAMPQRHIGYHSPEIKYTYAYPKKGVIDAWKEVHIIEFEPDDPHGFLIIDTMRTAGAAAIFSSIRIDR